MLFVYVSAALIPKYGRRKFNSLVKRYQTEVSQIQHDRLMHILNIQSNTVYGKENNFATITSREQFRKSVSLAKYDHFEPYMERIAAGEENVLTHQPVAAFSSSSGTTGKNKLIPFLSPQMKDSSFFVVMLYLMSIKIKRVALGQVATLRYKPVVRFSQCGLPIAPLTYHYNKHNPHIAEITPIEVLEIANEETALYVIAVFSFVDEEVSDFSAGLSTLAYSFWKIAESKWQNICNDIANGSLDNTLNLELNLRKTLEERMIANPQRAEQLRNEFQKGMEGICKRIWPSCAVGGMIITGGLAHHAKLLAAHAMKGIQLVSAFHASSEGMIGMNMRSDPNDISYSFLIELIFFEFIAEEDCDKENPPTLFTDQVEYIKIWFYSGLH